VFEHAFEFVSLPACRHKLCKLWFFEVFCSSSLSHFDPVLMQPNSFSNSAAAMYTCRNSFDLSEDHPVASVLSVSILTVVYFACTLILSWFWLTALFVDAELSLVFSIHWLFVVFLSPWWRNHFSFVGNTITANTTIIIAEIRLV
jgi:hypothetical protein